MLKHFLYLNERALADYLSAMEDGARRDIEARTLRGGGAHGKAGFGGVGVDGSRSSEAEETISRTDTPTAQFERLMALVQADPTTSGWIEVLDANSDLVDIGRGALIEIECEIAVPQTIRALGGSGELAALIDTMQTLSPLAAAMGKSTAGMPDAASLEAVKGVSGILGNDSVVVGEPHDSEWHIAGKLKGEWIRDDIAEYARVVGKVSSVLRRDEMRPLLALPGMSLMNRDQRREMERRGPSADNEDSWIAGPAVMLEVLAIYR